MSDDNDSIDEKFSDDEHLEAARRRFEESTLWHEHKRHHEEEGTEAILVVSEETVVVRPNTAEPRFEEAEEVSRKLIPVGSCQCQSPSSKLKLDDHGAVTPGFPDNEPTQVYGLGSGTSTTTEAYGAAPSGPTESMYQRGPAGTVKDVYKG